MAHLPRVSQKHSASWSRKILTLNKVKSLLTKPGKRYQVFHRQWVSLSSFEKTTHHFACSIRDCNSTSPMDIIAVDSLKVDRGAGGYEYILVIIEQFTRYALAYATTNKSAKLLLAERLFNDFLLKFGTPNRILHDQGK